MADRPDARELLDVAQAALAEVTARAAGHDRYTLKMVARAMAIAQREMAAVAASDATAELWARVERCDAADIALQRVLHAELLALTLARLAISDPRRLPRDPASR